ncbi:MAG: NAD(P)H-dependent oxidoreductase subunit E, partial [Phycisphaerae bacterium]
MTDIDLQPVDDAIAEVGRGPEATIPLLQAVQKAYRYLPEPALRRIAERTDISAARIEGVASFYAQFRRIPMGDHLIRVCVGTACHVKGAGVVHEAIARHLGIPEGRDTDPDRRFTLAKVACLGCCTLAPVLQIDGITFPHVTAERVPQVIRDFLESEQRRADRGGERRGRPAAGPQVGAIRITLDTCCIARGSGHVYEALLDAVADTGAPAVVRGVGCTGMSYLTPLVTVVEPDGTSAMYAGVTPEDAEAIVLHHFPPPGALGRAGKTVSRLLDQLLTDEAWDPLGRHAVDARDPPIAEFLGPQTHIATEHSGRVRPTDLDQYLEQDGCQALADCLRNRGAEEIIETIDAAGLRGRGGAGYPTATKWRQVRGAAGSPKYLVMNGAGVALVAV